MQIVNEHLAIKADLMEPTDNGFLLLAAEIGSWAGPIALPSPARKRLLSRIAPVVERLADHPEVAEATAFRAALRPPGEGADLLRRNGVRPARYDLVVLIRTTTVAAIESVRTDPVWRELTEILAARAQHLHQLAASNPARIADVDHHADSWFLFNYFHCADVDVNYDVWEYTAGWFQRNTDLPDSALMQPLPGEPADYSIINHASWPSLRTFLPALLFHPHFRSFVLANFAANEVAAQPIMYRRVR
ncbi:hypothetical protein IU438_14345 [Nocardia cyriacigeorgica]|uniref:Uncharacterized protein n=2 Tax=Nocardia cyriacigeorgica TaxID=135487 RepID=H6R8L1_NOCCG|nr:hypothetical protein [Nocardia cyriacigeorgica]MBF6084881.1 hypothetical protein [Nocardia cyriacigeorgica]MBF6087675.1 hypothetical protein [Nocardia cyriacigeorgica]MBF6092394.1 hypothetical protein [Nocardia cyriacigeorgica]MBF6396970.1 hypothetical protein [Nocardia cyriacigeorgica]MBF6403372.1 hypothetical protein [Nocardia cyriacigeorgica]